MFDLDGVEYSLEVLGGELSIGETVDLYRTPDEKVDANVGVGTVLQAGAVEIATTGTVDTLAVSTGDTVWRGQLLVKTRGRDKELTAAEDGIVTAVNTSAGATLQAGEEAVAIVRPQDIVITMDVDGDAAEELHIGDTVTYTLLCEQYNIEHEAMVETKSAISTSENVTIVLRPAETLSYLGLTAQVTW